MAQRWIVAALRHRKFFHLADLNEAIAELLDRLNARPFRKRPDVSRTLLFEQLDRPALKPLPANATSSLNGSLFDPISTITSRSNGITTACRFNWWGNNWTRATPP